jgi:hypothetical protein
MAEYDACGGPQASTPRHRSYATAPIVVRVLEKAWEHYHSAVACRV